MKSVRISTKTWARAHYLALIDQRPFTSELAVLVDEAFAKRSGPDPMVVDEGRAFVDRLMDEIGES